MASFVESNGRPRDMSDRVAAILAELDGVRVHLTEIAEEEKKVDGYSSGTLTNMVRALVVTGYNACVGGLL